MSDRIKGFTVVLDADYKAEYAKQIQQSIAMIKGVLEVQIHVRDVNDYIQRTRIRTELSEKFMAILWPVEKSSE